MIVKRIRKIRPRLNSWASRFLPRALVLIYHRVADLETDPQRLSVSLDNFEKHMEIVSTKYYPISLNELVDNLGKGIVHDKTVVVTFDDGYEDNYKYARPILEKCGVPATIFVATGYTGVNREFWWDELEKLILTRPMAEGGISLELGAEEVRWLCSGREGNNRDCRSPRDFYQDLCSRFQCLDAQQIENAIAKLRSDANDTGEPRTEYTPMSADQLRALHNGGLIEIGAHTRSHVNLAMQTPQHQREEIEGSKMDLERMLDTELKNFSYPFGTLSHYTSRTVKCVKEAGFISSTANYSGNVTRLTNRYEIPRRIVRNWNEGMFARALEQYYTGRRHIAESVSG